MIDYVILSLKNLKRRGLRSWLTMLGIFIGISAVVSLISLGNGLQNAISAQISSLSIDTLLIQGADTGLGPPGLTSINKISSKEFDKIKKIPGVKYAIKRYLQSSKIEYNNAAIFGLIGSIPEKKEDINRIKNALNLHIKEGKFIDEKDSGVVVVGYDFTKKDLFGKKVRAGSKIYINDNKFKVIGVLKKSSNIGLNRVIMIPEKDFKNLFNVSGIDFVIVKVENPDDISKVAEKIKTLLRKERKEKIGEEDFEVQTPIETLSTVNTILEVINIVISGIALIALLIGGIGIMNTMFTSVVERTKEIGIMKSVGAKNSSVLMIFLFEAGFLGLVGGIIGAIIGLSLAFGISHFANLYFGSNLINVEISFTLISFSLVFSLLIGIFSGVFPAIQASKMNPVEALRA